MTLGQSALASALMLALAAAAAGAGAPLTDIDGVSHGRLDAADGKVTAIFFLLNDCPISNQLAPEINRICHDYAEQGVRCFLAYAGADVSADALRRHQQAFGYDCCPALQVARRTPADAAGATVTPEAALFSADGELLYRGRVNDLYAALGKKRSAPTQHDVRRALDEILGGRSVSRPRTQAIGCYLPPRGL